MFTVCITGHRPDKLPGGYNLTDPKNLELINLFENQLINIQKEYGYIRVITGMALGTDQLFAIAAINLINKGNFIDLVAAIPCLDQEKVWPEQSQKLYHEILQQCCKVVNVTNKPYNSICMQQRNEYMVDHSDLIIAVWNGSSGGTKNCIDYASSKNKPIIRITPNY